MPTVAVSGGRAGFGLAALDVALIVRAMEQLLVGRGTGFPVALHPSASVLQRNMRLVEGLRAAACHCPALRVQGVLPLAQLLSGHADAIADHR